LVRAVKLPFLNVELPLKAFFALAPFVVVIIHAYALMLFIMLGKKASRFHNELRRQFPDSETKSQKSGAAPDGAQKDIRDKLRRLLPSNIFVQILAGPPELRSLWLLRPPILADLSAESFGRARVLARVLRGFGLGLAGVTSIAALWFSIVVATIPNEWQETALAVLDRPRWRVTDVKDGKEGTKRVSTHDLLFAGEVDETTRRRKSLFSNTLVLPGFNLYEALKIDEPKKLAWREHLIDLRGRHLEKAVLDGADLTKADLTGAQLQRASLFLAQLQGASLDFARLQGASLMEARLQGASLGFAQLQGASLILAQLQGAFLGGVYLQGAVLFGADLQGASLLGTDLQGAVLNEAQLQGASLEGAQLQGASLDFAQLQGASLEGAQLQGASLRWAQLQGSSLIRAAVNAADFSDAFLWRTNWGEIDPAKLGAVRLKDSTWKPVRLPSEGDPVRWDAKAYAELRVSMNSIPEGNMRDEALKRIETLDCANKTQASCDPAAAPPLEVLDWQKKLAAADADNAAYEKALATELRGLVCANDTNAIHILRGIVRKRLPWGVERLGDTRRGAPALVDFIMSKDCPVSASLTDDDKAKLLQIKQDAEKESAPPPAPKKEK
jgi:uncharacterized protein YjbI with pentapeptide repeats